MKLPDAILQALESKRKEIASARAATRNAASMNYFDGYEHGLGFARETLIRLSKDVQENE